jgi:hypothetical protein
MRSFGTSAPMKVVAEHFGLKAAHVVVATISTKRGAAGGTSLQDDEFNSKEKANATWHDRSWSNGRQYGKATHEGRPRMHRL